ncbi:MAG: glucose-1-phosphate adenylyltransferase [Verrucomicrobia bacterium]|nr:glucose-1-phosphate adenylyltransferase [Verrucomicrobiota bacterium]
MNAVAVILGGGEGSRLQPLTRDRAKPAVPIAGKYRLVDIPISNCINSGIRRMYLLTQFNSVSLHQHIQSTYRFDEYSSGFVRLMAAQQTPGQTSWYEGTADAVRKTFTHFLNQSPDYIIILSGDQLYRMDFSEVLEQHIANGADATISTKPVSRSETRGLGIMQVDENQRITNFVEKPKTDEELDPLRAPMYDNETYLASMGIYVFSTKCLQELLDSDMEDFGGHIIPTAIKQYKVYSYIFNGYWRDIGTVGSFWEANLQLTEVLPEFTFYEAKAPIYTQMRYLPPSKINRCDLNRCLLTEGCIVSGHRILNSIVGIRAIVGDASVIEHSVIMGADYYEEQSERPRGSDGPALGIGRECYIKNAIIDKNARIGHGCYITPDGKGDGTVTDLYTVRDGVIVIPKNTIVPDGTRL